MFHCSFSVWFIHTRCIEVLSISYAISSMEEVRTFYFFDILFLLYNIKNNIQSFSFTMKISKCWGKS